ncbi:uncharacterized protein C2845_PM07G03600 [Panicum miliaceum]|uniref:DUF1664 domain-containing protein n=1 Tax=Panicum miliaceum TaxID=4540 RepID=A0A3L6SSP8_PANMI|nr:uncharacterized protein C2845_PM07G03600 [Panicum miliaceum]
MVLGKVAIVIGSGIVGTVLTSGESSLPDFRDVISGAFKFMTKGAKKGKDGPSTSSPHTAQLLTQVNYLREELQMLSKSNHVAIVTVDGRPGPGAYGITAVVIGAIGYLFIRWKGWKLSDMMFVTKRGLSDACNVVGKQVDQVSESVHVAKRHLAGRIDRVDCSLDECQEITEATRKEVTIIHGDLSAFQKEMETVHLVVRSLETKLGRLAYTQDRTTRGIYDLCEFTKRLEQSPKADTRQASQQSVHDSLLTDFVSLVTSSTPRPAIESSERVAKTVSLPPALEPESPPAQSPRPEAPKVVRSTTMSASGLNMLVGTTMPPKRDHQGVFSRASSMKEGSSELPSGAPSTAEPSPRRSGSSTLFGGFGFLRSYTS